MPVIVTVADFGFDATWDRLAELDGARIETGLHDPKEALKGAINEFGSPARGIPARPWLSRIDTKTPRIGSAMAQGVGAVADGAQAEPVLEQVGAVAQTLVRSIIVNDETGGPPLAASTVAAKGSAKKLVEDGDMVRAIKSEVTL